MSNKLLDSMNRNASVHRDASALWNGSGQVPLLDYLRVRCALSERETALTAQLVKNVRDLLYGTQRYYGYGLNEEAEYRRILSVQLKDLGLDGYERIYCREWCCEPVIDFPVTENIIEKALSEQKILITTHDGERTAVVGNRRFALDNETFLQDGPACAVRKSMEMAFLGGRTEDYAYADAVLRDGGRLKTKNYSDNSNWGKSIVAGHDYDSFSYRNDEKRFAVKHVHGVKGQVREHWILYDLITGEQQEAKTFIQCRMIAKTMSHRISRYELYAYRPGTDAFYRGRVVRMNAFKAGPDGLIVARCTEPGGNGEEFSAELRELYLKEEDACLPGEDAPCTKGNLPEDGKES